MDDEIIHSWCFHDVECFDSTPSAAIIILDKDLESFSSLRSQQKIHVIKWKMHRKCMLSNGHAYKPIISLAHNYSFIQTCSLIIKPSER